MHAVFLDFDSVTRGDIDRSILETVTSPWIFYGDTDATQLVERIRDAEIIVTNKTALGRDTIFAANRLKLICVSATGYNNIDLVAAAERDVAVCNVRGYATQSVTQHVFMLMLALTTHFVDYQHLVKSGGWQASQFFCRLDYPIEELAGKTLGIIGYGELGRAVARVAEVFGMRVLVAEHKEVAAASVRAGRTVFDEVLAHADFISLHCPLFPETANLIGEREFALMRPSACLINTARGGLVDEAALLQSLQCGRIAGAAIDVLKKEPPEANHPLLTYSCSNLIITPHIAWASRSARQRVLELVAENIDNFRHGRNFNQITDALRNKANPDQSRTDCLSGNLDSGR